MWPLIIDLIIGLLSVACREWWAPPGPKSIWTRTSSGGCTVSTSKTMSPSQLLCPLWSAPGAIAPPAPSARYSPIIDLMVTGLVWAYRWQILAPECRNKCGIGMLKGRLWSYRPYWWSLRGLQTGLLFNPEQTGFQSSMLSFRDLILKYIEPRAINSMVVVWRKGNS